MLYLNDKFQDGQPMKFSQMAAMHSELVAINMSGQLCQWRWNDTDPYGNNEVVDHFEN